MVRYGLACAAVIAICVASVGQGTARAQVISYTAALSGPNESPPTTSTATGLTFVDFNLQIRIAGVTIFWVIRNARASRQSYVPGHDYLRNDQFYGVRWRFTD